MVIFFDTSALIKRYIDERGTEAVNRLFRQAGDIAISVVTKAEIVSALNFKRRLMLLSDRDYNGIMTEFERNCTDFVIQAIDAAVEAKIRLCAERYAHKTLDNIQLASALVLKPAYFATADKKLARLAKLEKLRVKLV